MRNRAMQNSAFYKLVLVAGMLLVTPVLAQTQTGTGTDASTSKNSDALPSSPQTDVNSADSAKNYEGAHPYYKDDELMTQPWFLLLSALLVVLFLRWSQIKTICSVLLHRQKDKRTKLPKGKFE